MDFTSQQLADLKEAYATGALIVKHGDKTTQFRSLPEMKRQIEAIEKEITNHTNSKKSFLGGRAWTPTFMDH